MYNFAADFIYANSDISSTNYNVCNKMAINLIIDSIRINSMVFVSYAMSVCIPIYRIFFMGENDMIYPIILPFIDPESQNGYQINFVYQMIGCVAGGIIIPGAELLTCIMKNNISAIAAVIKNSILEFEIQLKIDSSMLENDIDCQFQNILLSILDFDRFVLNYYKSFFHLYTKSN